MSTLEANDAFQDRGLIKLIGKNGSTAIYNVAEVTSAGEIRVIQSIRDDADPQTFEDTSFVVGDSPATLDANTALGRNASEFTVINDGAGDFTVSISRDGAAFGDEHTMKNGETYSLANMSVDSIRITHVADSAYRVIVI